MHALFSLTLLLSAVAAPPPQFDIQLLDGTRVSGSVARWDDAKVVLETPAGPREFDAAKVVSAAAHVPPAKPPAAPAVWVDLVDGSRLAGTEYTTDKGRAKITSAADIGEDLDIATADVSAVRMQAESEAASIEWSRIRNKKLPGDLLVTGNQTGIDFHQGTIEDVTDQKVQFTLDGKTIAVKRAKVYGLIYYHAAAAAANESPFTIIDSAGSRWVSPTLKLDDGAIEFTAAGGRAVRRPLDQIAQIDLSSGKIVYLSDVKPDSESYTPYAFSSTEKALPSRAQFARVRRDENQESKSLRTHDQEFRKGLAMQSRSELAWTLPGKFARLQAIAGIDDEVRPLGCVRVHILGDGKSLFDAVVNGSDAAALPISLDMTGVRRLVLVVESEGNFAAGDHLVLGNLRLIK